MKINSLRVMNKTHGKGGFREIAKDEIYHYMRLLSYLDVLMALVPPNKYKWFMVQQADPPTVESSGYWLHLWKPNSDFSHSVFLGRLASQAVDAVQKLISEKGHTL